MYYNDTFKQNYLETLSRRDQRNRANKMFDTAKEIETEKGKDLGLWNHDEVVWLISRLATIDLVTLKTQILDVYAYQQWYLREIGEGEDNNEAAMNVACNQKKIVREDVNFETAFRDCTYLDVAESLREIASVIELDHGNVTPPAICFAWLNIDIEVAVQIPKDGVNFRDGTVRDEHGNILAANIPDEIVSVLRTYDQTLIGKQGRKPAYPIENGKFLRHFESSIAHANRDPFTVNVVTTSISRVKNKIMEQCGSPRLSYANVQKSAQFKMMLDREPTSFLSPEGRQFVEKLCGNGKKDFQKSRIYDVLYMYEQYKKVFNLN